MRTDPDPDRDARLVVELAGGAAGADEGVDLAAVVAAEGRFGTTVVVPETAVDALCSTPGLARVETANTLGLALEDAGGDDRDGTARGEHVD
jgi:hypothetical protein